MKKSIACTGCRSSKRRCIHKGTPPCDRCRERDDECIFPPKGTSYAFRRAKPASGLRPYVDGGSIRDFGRNNESRGRSQYGPQEHRNSGSDSPASIAAQLSSPSNDDPFRHLTDEVKACYVRCSYKWSFHHIPSLLVNIQKQTLDETLAWAILAIAVRYALPTIFIEPGVQAEQNRMLIVRGSFSQHPPEGHSSQIEASNAFASRARALVLPTVDEPNLQRTQALLLLTGHSWGAGEGRRAWVLLGTAVRMAETIGLFEEAPLPTSSDEFITAETRRRTAWTCFLMDSLLSGGKGRDRSVSAQQMKIQLPCDMDSFNFGEPVKCEMLDGSFSTSSLPLPTGDVSIIACTLRVADIWGNVAKWACSSHEGDASPWLAQSRFQSLLSRLDAWVNSLPRRLRYDMSLLHAHTVSNQGQAYCYMHCIHFLSVIFLYRSYLPEVEMEQPMVRAPEWMRWSSWSSKQLVTVAEKVCEMLQEMRGLGLFFLRGLVPWVGFAIYTALGALLYFFHFPFPEAEEARVQSWRFCIVEGCNFLKEMRQSWPMADTWRDTIQRMQIFYSSVKSQGSSAVTPTERRAMRHAIIDYGGLQPFPVGEAEQVSVHATPEEVGNANLQSPIMDAPEMTPSDPFDVNFNFTELMDAIYVDATQGFWESFPGTTGI